MVANTSANPSDPMRNALARALSNSSAVSSLDWSPVLPMEEPTGSSVTKP